MVFGAGAALGLVVVSAELPGIGWVASLMMAAGIGLLPLAFIADWRRARRAVAKRRAKPKAKRRAGPPRRRTSRKR